MATDKSATVSPSGKEPARPPARPTAPARTPGTSSLTRFRKYLGEVNTELKKTTWPTRPELVAQTQVVLGLLVLLGVFMAAWDAILGQIVKGILNLIGVRQ
jgi:preprotein translocase SecE subunit